MRISLGLAYADVWIVVCDWCGRASEPAIDRRGLEAILSTPDRFGHFFTFHRPGPDWKRHECHWCRSEREWQVQLEAIRQRAREEVERERQQRRAGPTQAEPAGPDPTPPSP